MSPHATQSFSLNSYDFLALFADLSKHLHMFFSWFQGIKIWCRLRKYIHFFKFCSFSMPKTWKIDSFMSLMKFLSLSLFTVAASILLQKYKSFTVKNCFLYLCFLCIFFPLVPFWLFTFFFISVLSVFLVYFLLRLNSTIVIFSPILCNTMCKALSFLFVWKPRVNTRKQDVLCSSNREPLTWNKSTGKRKS